MFVTLFALSSLAARPLPLLSEARVTELHYKHVARSPLTQRKADLRRVEGNLQLAADDRQSLQLRKTGEHAFDFTPAARCVPGHGRPAKPGLGDASNQPMIETEQSPVGYLNSATAAQCEAACARHESCQAAEFVHPQVMISALPPPEANGSCVLHSGCLERTRAAAPRRSDIMHRWGPSWPPGAKPSTVVWSENATLVLVTFSASLGWLRTVPGGLLDLVVYRKFDYGRVPRSWLHRNTNLSAAESHRSIRSQAQPVTGAHLEHRGTTPQDILDQLKQQELCASRMPDAHSLSLQCHSACHLPALHYVFKACRSPPCHFALSWQVKERWHGCTTRGVSARLIANAAFARRKSSLASSILRRSPTTGKRTSSHSAAHVSSATLSLPAPPLLI